MTEVPPYKTAFPSLNMPNVVPERFTDVWANTLDKWGQAMKNAWVFIQMHLLSLISVLQCGGCGGNELLGSWFGERHIQRFRALRVCSVHPFLERN